MVLAPSIAPTADSRSSMRRRIDHDSMRGGIFPSRQNDRHRQETRGFEPGVEAVHIHEAAHHEAGSRKQHQRERQLGDDERRGPFPGAHALPIPNARLLSGPR